jgi:hypothetical protein
LNRASRRIRIFGAAKAIVAVFAAESASKNHPAAHTFVEEFLAGAPSFVHQIRTCGTQEVQ